MRARQLDLKIQHGMIKLSNNGISFHHPFGELRDMVNGDYQLLSES